MQIKNLWKEITKYEVECDHFMSRQLVTIPTTDFEQFKKYFDIVKNPLNTFTNYRTDGKFNHIHAIEEGEYVQVHIDHINPEFLWLAPFHLFTDMIPYFLDRLLKRRTPYKLYFKK